MKDIREVDEVGIECTLTPGASSNADPYNLYY
jgi:hypothetical protein